MAIIYGLRDPRDNLIHYIGKTNDLHGRLAAHKLCKGCNRSRKEWLRDLLESGAEPEAVILEEIPHEVWRETEEKWISQARLENWPLTNKSSGGGGPPDDKGDIGDYVRSKQF